MTTLATDRDWQALLADLDEGPFLTLRAMADHAEGSGDDVLSRGLRWLAENRRSPTKRRAEWMWWLDDTGERSKIEADDLPQDIMPGGDSAIGLRGKTSSEAYLNAGRAVGEWLLKQQEAAT